MNYIIYKEFGKYYVSLEIIMKLKVGIIYLFSKLIMLNPKKNFT